MFSESILCNWDPEPFREALSRAGYTRQGLEAADLYRPGDAVARTHLAPKLLPADSSLLTAIRLFDLGEPVSGKDAMALFGSNLLGLMRIGLLEGLGNDLVRSAAKIDATEQGWFAFDHAAALVAAKPDYVMGEGNSSRMLTALATGRKGERVLDLGAGAGWGALRLAERGCRVTAADISARALGFARFNVLLAGLDDIEIVQGDRFEPVAGRKFDAIASNPPFVISPQNTFVFRDGGVKGDGFCESLVRRFPDYLEEGGIAVMIFNWFDEDPERWDERPLAWAKDRGCDVWLFRSDRHDPAEYAFRWLRESGRGRNPKPEDLNEWTRYYRELGAKGINLGFLAMRKRTGKNWQRSDSRAEVKVVATAGEEIRRIFDNQTWLNECGLDDAAILAMRFKVPDGIRAETDMVLDRGWGMRTIRLRSSGQLSYDGQVDEFILRLLEVCRSGGTPGDQLKEILAKPEFAGTKGVDGQIASLVREMVRHGLLLPAL
ncbi:methyltransferase [Luteolibacter luteus]|uniref:Methyltransferase n=1 Tax=Luteolibacter luteus TaxID=2728835 RepID=A0A858RL54_9BACT|nr:methyltransferase [Luteolibacter luteus]QJE96743.1 methyltransferase [Luteolibacter luteus]